MNWHDEYEAPSTPIDSSNRDEISAFRGIVLVCAIGGVVWFALYAIALFTP